MVAMSEDKQAGTSSLSIPVSAVSKAIWEMVRSAMWR
jgi:hypothetical protein